MSRPALRLATVGAALLLGGAALLPAPLPAAAPVVTGTWIGTLRIAGVPRKLAVQLHRRANNEVYGYVLGGTSGLSISGGRLTGARLALNLVAKDPGAAAAFAISGSIAGASLDGTARSGAAIQPVHWTRQPAGTVLHERRVFFALQGPEGDPVGLTELAVALNGAGALVAGGFVGVESCALFGCAGAVRTFRELGDALDVGLHPAGGCAAGSALHATFDPESRFYAGSFTLNTCPGTRSDDALGARGTRARSDHVAGMLATLARLADDLEARRTFGAMHPAFWASYLHSGTRLGARLAELNAQTHGYNPLKVTFDRFRAASSVEDPTTLDRLDRAFGLDFHDRRSGKPVGGGPPVVLRDTDMENLLVTELRYFRRSGAAWILSGDQLPAFDMPFEYALGADHLKAATPGGTVYVSLGPWGAHFTPLTGHAYGDAKANLAGFLAHQDSELVELEGDRDGAREPGEVWGYWGGGDGSAVRSRVPVYRSPYAGRVVEVSYQHGPTGVYFDNPPQWRVEIAFPNGLELALDHVARIASPLRDLVLAATGIDTDSYAGPAGDLLDGATLPIARHTLLAYPQVMAQEIAGHPGHYRGGGTFTEVPWAQIEFFLHAPVAGAVSADVCIYQHLLPAKRTQLQSILNADVAHPRSERFTNPFGVRWQWGAEGALCNAYSTYPDGFASLHTRLGGWFERGAPGTAADEIFAIVPIAKGAAAYRAADYSSPAVSHLVLRRRRNTDGPFSWTLPGGIVAHPPYPAGEVLAQSATALLVKWRDIVAPGDAWYQRAAYRLDGSGLKIEWGAFAASPAAAPLPALAPGEPCNDTSVLCYDHQHRPGF